MLFFNIILPMGLTGGVMVAAILVIRPLLHRWRTHGVLLLLWVCACALLLVPFRLSSTASVYNAANKLPVISEAFTVKTFIPVTSYTSYAFITAEDENTSGANAEHTVIIAGDGSGNSALSDLNRQQFTLATVWSIGFCAVLCYTIVSALLLRYRFRGAVPRIDLPSDVASVTGFKRKIRIYASSRTSGTVTYGFIRPRVILPVTFNYDDETALNYVLLHEFQHIRNLDALVNLVWVAVLCVHWFNPLVWYGWVCMRRDMETRCDAQVVGRIGAKRRAGYAQTLLDMVPVRRGNVFPLAFGSSSAKERIKHILLYRPATKRAVCAALSVLFCCVVSFATNPIQAAVTGQTKQIADTDSITIFTVNGEHLLIDKTSDKSSLNLYRLNPLGFNGECYQETYTLCDTFESYSEVRDYFAEIYSIESEILTQYIRPENQYQEKFGFGVDDGYVKSAFSFTGQSILVETDRGMIYYALMDTSTFKSDDTDPQTLTRAIYLLENIAWSHATSYDDNFTNPVKLK